MTSLRVTSGLMLTILFLALSYKTQSAPAHHLTIGVQGNTPTLIVTSSEVGITPSPPTSTSVNTTKIEHSDKYDKATAVENKFLTTRANKNQNLFNKKIKLPHLRKPFAKSFLTQGTSNNVTNSSATNQILHRPLNQSTKSISELDSFKIKATSPATPTTTEISESYKINSPSAIFTPKQINNIPLSSSAIPQVNTAPGETITENTSSLPSIISDEENLHTSPVGATTLATNNFEDTTTTVNYNDKIQAVIVLDASTQTEAAAYVNDVVTPTPNTMQKLLNVSDIKIENKAVADGRTKDRLSISGNENLLLTTVRTNGFTTPSTSTLATSTTDNAEATTGSELSLLSLTMAATTKENNSNNKKRQQLVDAENIDKEIFGPPKEADKGKKIEEKHVENRSILVNSRANHTLTPTRLTFAEPKSTENPLKAESVKVHQESFINTTAEEPIQNKTLTEIMKGTKHIATTEAVAQQQQQTVNKLTTNQQQIETTTIDITPLDHHNEFAISTTTEAVLKLIDLEKHVMKTIEELKQPMLLIAGQHDNGHDGLKNIKKKQLIDKHYVEALLHSKQDPPTKPSTGNGKPTTQAPVKNLNSGRSTKFSKKPVIMSTKHGYLGPILMEEKTFHVIHHANDNSVTGESHHADDVESQLRKGHFVELKAKKEVEANKTIKSSVARYKEMLEMQSDQPLNILDKNDSGKASRNKGLSSSIKASAEIKNDLQDKSTRTLILNSEQKSSSTMISTTATILMAQESNKTYKNFEASKKSKVLKSLEVSKPEMMPTTTENSQKNSFKGTSNSTAQTPSKNNRNSKLAPVLSTTVFQVIDSVATKTPIVQADTLFTTQHKEKSVTEDSKKEKTESKISDIQIEIYDSTVDSIVASTNFKDIESGNQSSHLQTDESYLGKTTKPPVSIMQQERFTQYVIDRMETSTPEPINYSTIQVASGKPEPAAIEIHINVSESFGNESEDVEFSYPQGEYINNNNSNNGRTVEELYDDNKISDSIKLKIPSNWNGNGRELKSDEILVVEVIDTDNNTVTSLKGKSHNTDELFISDVKDIYTTPPPPPPPPPFQTNFDRDSDTIFYISNTEVKVGESLPATKSINEERKLKLESQFFPANYMASTHPNLNKAEDSNPTHHLYEEDIIVSSNHNEADSLKIYRNNNEPAPPLDVTYVGESIIEVEQSPETVITTTFAPDQQRNAATPQPDVIIQPAVLPEISIGVPVIGELPPQIELKEIDFMPNEPQLHRSSIYDDNDNNSNNNLFSNDIDENTINGSNNNHDAEVASGNSNSNQRVDELSIQYGGDLIDESADGGFDGVEGSYPFSNPATADKSFAFASPSSHDSSSSAFLTKLRKQQEQEQQKQQQQQPNHVADYTHLYVNYGVSNMRKDELNADIKDSGEMLLLGSSGNGNEQNITTSKGFLNKVSMNNSTVPFMSVNSTQSERMSNATAFSVMEDANDLEDKNTEDIINLISLAIGLFIVILPVVVTCSMFWALRYLYKKYHSNLMDTEEYADQTETKGALNGGDLEKGEDISRVARETKMDYNKDGVFVVEVARGIDSKTIPESPVTEGNERMLSMFDVKQNNGGLGYKMSNEKNYVNNEKVQIHSPPIENQEDGPRSLHQIEEVEEPLNSPHLTEIHEDIVGLAYKANTGLSQSDLSSTSSSDSNKGYCYGKQELYVVEQRGYTAVTPNGNVVLSCDVKDIKDDDRNPGNDPYLKHSPDRREEINKNNKENVVETFKKPEEGGSRTGSGESPEQKQNDKVKECLESSTMKEMSQRSCCPEIIVEDEIKEDQNNCNIEMQSEILTKSEKCAGVLKENQNICIPVEIEIHITPSEEESPKESLVLEETQSVAQPLAAEHVYEVIENCVALQLAQSNNSPQKEEIKSNAHAPNGDSNKTTEDRENPKDVTEDNEVRENLVSENRKTNGSEPEVKEDIEVEHLKINLETNGLLIKQNGHYEDSEEEFVKENNEILNQNPEIFLNNVAENKIVEFAEKDENQKREILNGTIQPDLLVNGISGLTDAPTEPKTQNMQKGYSKIEQNGNCLNEIENGYDSIVSLPEPPLTTEEQLNNDLSDQQLDSLPPPPPPEIFNLKDLPPPLTNGNTDSPQSEESNNFYSTLPPPPPTTMATSTATAGKVHASPLTPPASPPALFTNNLHAGLCSQPIAVDVNGS